MLNLTQVQTSPEFLKIVLQKKDFNQLGKENKKHVGIIFITQLKCSTQNVQLESVFSLCDPEVQLLFLCLPRSLTIL